MSLRPALAKLGRPYLKKKRSGSVAQVVELQAQGPGFNPPYC
jgi:hypothetical protein